MLDGPGFTVPGLRNTGNTCFWAAALQALASTPAFAARLTTAAEAAPPGRLPLTRALLDLLRELRPSAAPRRVVDASALLVALRERVPEGSFAAGEQHDAAEALEALLDAVCEELQAECRGSEAAQPSLAGLLRGSPLQQATSRQLRAPREPASAAAWASGREWRLRGACAVGRSLARWQAAAATALTGHSAQEMRCSACGGSFATQLARFHTLLLPLPQAPGQALAAPGASVHACLQAACQAIELVAGVACARCSLRATLQQAGPSSPQGVGSSQSFEDLRPAESASSEDGLAAPGSPAASSSSRTSDAGLGPASEQSKALATLRSLSSAGSHLPEAEALQRLAAAAGLRWAVRHRRVARTCPIAKAPQVLALHLKRGLWTPSGQHLKLGGRVAFPAELDLGPFVSTAAAAAPVLLYRLTAAVVHVGHSRAGHYLLFRRACMPARPDPPAASEDLPVEDRESAALEPEPAAAWFCISDHSVRAAELAEVLACEATLLVYERL